MFAQRAAFALTMVFVLSARPARAFFDPPYITPAQPVAGQPISVNIRGGICDTIISLPGYPQITQKANVITILFFGVRNSTPESCYYEVGEAAFPAGSYPAGSYTLQVDLRYIDGFGSFVVDTLGTVPFVVTGAIPPPVAPAAAPTLSVVASSVLLLALAGLAVWPLRSRSSGL